MDQYHALSEATMTTLLEQLEDLLDALGSKDMEVDYHVRIRETPGAARLTHP